MERIWCGEYTGPASFQDTPIWFELSDHGQFIVGSQNIGQFCAVFSVEPGDSFRPDAGAAQLRWADHLRGAQLAAGTGHAGKEADHHGLEEEASCSSVPSAEAACCSGGGWSRRRRAA